MTREWKAILFSQVHRKLEALVASWKWSHVILRYYKNTATPSGWRFLAPSELGTDWQSGQVKPREVTRQQCRCGRARGGIESERIGQRGIKGGGDRATWRVVFISKFSYCFSFLSFLFFPFFRMDEDKVWKLRREIDISFFSFLRNENYSAYMIALEFLNVDSNKEKGKRW